MDLADISERYIDELLASVKSSWDSVAIPDGLQHVGRGKHAEDRFCFDTYANKHWLSVVESGFSPGYGSVSMMTSDSARAYYIGSYMYSFLRNYLHPERDRAELNPDVFGALHTVLDNIIRRGTAASSFTQAQLNTIVEFLTVFEKYDYGVSETLKEYIDIRP